jgi:hypothetical protein
MEKRFEIPTNPTLEDAKNALINLRGFRPEQVDAMTPSQIYLELGLPVPNDEEQPPGPRP